MKLRPYLLALLICAGCAPAPELIDGIPVGISDSYVARGRTKTVTIRADVATRWRDVDVNDVGFGPDVTVRAVRALGPHDLEVTINCLPWASVGPRTVWVNRRPLDDSFEVRPAFLLSEPVIHQGQYSRIEITGIDSTWDEMTQVEIARIETEGDDPLGWTDTTYVAPDRLEVVAYAHLHEARGQLEVRVRPSGGPDEIERYPLLVTDDAWQDITTSQTVAADLSQPNASAAYRVPVGGLSGGVVFRAALGPAPPLAFAAVFGSSSFDPLEVIEAGETFSFVSFDNNPDELRLIVQDTLLLGGSGNVAQLDFTRSVHAVSALGANVPNLSISPTDPDREHWFRTQNLRWRLLTIEVERPGGSSFSPQAVVRREGKYSPAPLARIDSGDVFQFGPFLAGGATPIEPFVRQFVAVGDAAGLSGPATSFTLRSTLAGPPSALFESLGPVPIDDGDTTEIDVSVAGVSGAVGNLHAYVDVEHTYAGDLIIDLTAPNGQTIVLWDQSGASQDGIVHAFPDTRAPDDTGSDMSVFSGINPNGIWRFTVRDAAPGETGVVRGFALGFD